MKVEYLSILIKHLTRAYKELSLTLISQPDVGKVNALGLTAA
jgi:hypothetical protein